MARVGRDWIARPLLTGAAAVLMRSISHGLHMALVFFGLLGWIVPQNDWLIAHLIFIPGLLVVWRLNENTCPINNLETWLTTGRWRNPANVEEGGFVRAAVARYMGIELSETVMNNVIYGLMGLTWLFSWLHLWLRQS